MTTSTLHRGDRVRIKATAKYHQHCHGDFIRFQNGRAVVELTMVKVGYSGSTIVDTSLHSDGKFWFTFDADDVEPIGLPKGFIDNDHDGMS